jgi:hypothetical protein
VRTRSTTPIVHDAVNPRPEPTPLRARLRTYQAERFPVAAYLPLVAVATFAALAYSRAARGESGFPRLEFAVGTLTLLVFFFLLRVLDEHKDAGTDAEHRPELPVPRGLVSLRELRWAAGGALGLVVVLNLALDAALLAPMGVVLGWAALMGREFFVAAWLRARPLAYLLSHMVVMPLIFLYATTLDWLVAGAPPPPGLPVFLALAFLNGLVIEVGRKLRAPGEEREGVETYTAAWGAGRAARAWLGILAAALVAGALAGRAIEAGTLTLIALTPLAIAAALPASQLLRAPLPGLGRRVEVASGLWVLACYATFGAIAFWFPGVLP